MRIRCHRFAHAEGHDFHTTKISNVIHIIGAPSRFFGYYIDDLTNEYSPRNNEVFDVSTYSIDGVFNFLDNRLYSDVQFAYSKTNESGSSDTAFASA